MVHVRLRRKIEKVGMPQRRGTTKRSPPANLLLCVCFLNCFCTIVILWGYVAIDERGVGEWVARAESGQRRRVEGRGRAERLLPQQERQYLETHGAKLIEHQLAITPHFAATPVSANAAKSARLSIGTRRKVPCQPSLSPSSTR